MYAQTGEHSSRFEGFSMLKARIQYDPHQEMDDGGSPKATWIQRNPLQLIRLYRPPLCEGTREEERVRDEYKAD